jgi:hypothetical protein
MQSLSVSEKRFLEHHIFVAWRKMVDVRRAAMDLDRERSYKGFF